MGKVEARQSNYHNRLKIKQSGANKAEARRMLRSVDANNDGNITDGEVDALAKKGQQAGFSDKDSLEYFRAGLDTAALAAQKGEQPGAQFTKKYLDKDLKDFLGKAYGAEAAKARYDVAGQASGELTAKAAGSLERRAFDQHQRDALRGVLGNARLIDSNNNGKIDSADRLLTPDGNGRFRPSALNSDLAARIRGNAGLNRAAARAGKPEFPTQDDKSKWTHRNLKQAERWMGKKTPAEGGNWSMTPATIEGDKYAEFKLAKGKSASKALDDIRKNPGNYCMDCAMFKQVAQLERIRGAVGDEKFDKLADKHGISVGYGKAENHSGLLGKVQNPVGHAGQHPKSYGSGWEGYANFKVKDPALQKKLESAGWGGEHFVTKRSRTGQIEAVGHPFSPMKAQSMDAVFKRKIINHAKDNYGVTLKPEDISVTYDRPTEVDLQEAKRLADQL